MTKPTLPKCLYCGTELSYHVWHEGSRSEIWGWECEARACGVVQGVHNAKTKELAIADARKFEENGLARR